MVYVDDCEQSLVIQALSSAAVGIYDVDGGGRPQWPVTKPFHTHEAIPLSETGYEVTEECLLSWVFFSCSWTVAVYMATCSTSASSERIGKAYPVFLDRYLEVRRFSQPIIS